jgi:tetratricopeptide (TPR) repeat protein
MRAITLLLLLLISNVQAQNVADMKDFIELLCREEKCDDAITMVNTALENQPNNDTLNYYKGWLKITCNKDYASALQDFDKGLSINPKSALNHFGKGVCLSKSNKPNDAIMHLNTAKKLNPKLPELDHYLGFCYYLLGDSNSKNFPKAIKFFNKSIKKDFERPENYLYQALAYYNLRNFKKASLGFGLYEEFTVDGQRDSILYLYGGLTNYQIENYDIAVLFMDKYLENHEPTTEILYYRGLANIKQGLMNEALVDLKRFIDENPSNANIFDDIAQGFYNSEEPEMAYVYWDKAAKMGHKKSIDIIKKYKASFAKHRKNLGTSIAFEVDKNWEVDDFSDTPSVSTCNGVIINDYNSRLTFAILANDDLKVDTKATCTFQNRNFSMDNNENIYTTSLYSWSKSTSTNLLETDYGTFSYTLIRFVLKIPNNNVMVYVYGKQSDISALDFYITSFLESIKINL